MSKVTISKMETLVTNIDNNCDEYLAALYIEVYGSEQEWLAEQRKYAPDGSDLEAILRNQRKLFIT